MNSRSLFEPGVLPHPQAPVTGVAVPGGAAA